MAFKQAVIIKLQSRWKSRQKNRDRQQRSLQKQKENLQICINNKRAATETLKRQSQELGSKRKLIKKAQQANKKCKYYRNRAEGAPLQRSVLAALRKKIRELENEVRAAEDMAVYQEVLCVRECCGPLLFTLTCDCCVVCVVVCSSVTLFCVRTCLMFDCVCVYIYT